MRDLPAMEPDLSLFVPRRRRILPGLVVLSLCLFGAWMLWPSPRSHRKPRPAPPPAETTRSPLYVTLVPPGEPRHPAQGWCCVDRKGAAEVKLSAASRTACETGRGVFFEEEAEARAFCSRKVVSCIPPGVTLSCPCDEIKGTRMTLLEAWLRCGSEYSKGPSGSPRGRGTGA
jgi:hypothetical protein